MSAAGSSGGPPIAERPRPQYPIESVDKALRLLTALAKKGNIRIGDASVLLDVSQSTAHRLMAMLVYHGFASQDMESRAYLAGPAITSVGLSAVRAMNLRNLAQPHLADLNRQFDETVHVAYVRRRDVLFIDCVESGQPLRVASRIGLGLPAHCSAVGKAVLATLPEERLVELYPDETLEGLTEHSLTSREALVEELEKIRADGHALSWAESEESIVAFGVAVTIEQSQPPAGLSLAMPMSRVTDQIRREVPEALIVTAERIREGAGVS